MVRPMVTRRNETDDSCAGFTTIWSIMIEFLQPRRSEFS